ncbi:hypothetical protein L3V77_00995 [Vibrio sp. DW001]|uniref:hypothetical protein n=1 Tax=Vibrio sp. DW001 TaxID=2912315 RepID=UPI0023AF3907|nr:hypothetical protein [Vibrio sp. DW001]WED26871.1 hypothetical protein L3V77_00995 [Vibrio sp. DW001]
MLEATRSHWGVEVIHWSLDTAFFEENSRIRADDRAEAFARIRQVCLNLLKSETIFKGGIKRKRLNCAMDENYLSKVLVSLRNGYVPAVSVWLSVCISQAQYI